jgi:hypothetical protein
MPDTCPVCEARRTKENEQAKARMRRLRERQRVTGNAVRVTHKKEGTFTGTPPQTSPVGGTTLSVERGKGVEAILAPFQARGYRHEPAFWAKMAAKYPALDLELEAMKLRDWLREPRNAKKRCSTPRIDNWLGIAEAKRLAPPAAAPSNGATNGVTHQPNSLKHNRRPDEPRLLTGDLTPIRPAELRRFQAERRKLSLEQRMAQWRGAGK